jgi:ABC-type nitrate/sulfonate/bicarbonate transport system permease component
VTRKDEPIAGETVEALEARTPFRFPREMVIALLVLAVAWQVVSLFVPPFVVPGWERIFKSLAGLPLDFVLVTLARVAVALALSFALGLGLAVLMYASTPVERYGRPIVRLLMAVPVVCWILFAVLWFKWVELRIAFVLIVVCGPVFLVDLLDAMRGVSKDLRDMLRSFRPTRAQLFTKLVLPATLPAMLTSWKINLSLAIRVVTIAELVGAVTGIGYGLVVAQELFSVAEVFAWTLILVVLLFLAEAALTRIEDRVLRWRA